MTPLQATLIAAVTAGAGSWLVVLLVLRYSAAGRLIDQPNDRSSHAVATPRGGGLGPVVAHLLAFGLLAMIYGWWSLPLACALAGAVAVAVIGWMDDHRSLAVGPRLAIHAVAACAVAWLAASILPPGIQGIAAAAAMAWWALWTVASINVINFVDGIDGLITSQVIFFAGFLMTLTSTGSAAFAFAAVLGTTSLGFLAWNWPPARIFLGDVGSGALGALTVIGGLLAMQGSGRPFQVVFLPLTAIFLDATSTLIRRWRRGHRVSTPHRLHLYQRLARTRLGHGGVSALYLAAATTAPLLIWALPGASAWAVAILHGAMLISLGFALERAAPFPP